MIVTILQQPITATHSALSHSFFHVNSRPKIIKNTPKGLSTTCFVGPQQQLQQRKNGRYEFIGMALLAELESDQSGQYVESSNLLPSSDFVTDLRDNGGRTSDNTNSLEATALLENALQISTETSTSFMITQEMKRIMIEELGYKRSEANRIRVELAGPLIENRIFRPSDGIPLDWLVYDEENDSRNRMMAKLEAESKYPLKVPLLAVSLVLSGKGISDAIITLIKWNMGFKGVSLTSEFMGIPVLAIDFVCAFVGISLGIWTWRNMNSMD